MWTSGTNNEQWRFARGAMSPPMGLRAIDILSIAPPCAFFATHGVVRVRCVPAQDLHHRFSMDCLQGGCWSILISRLLLYTSEQQPYSNGYFKREDWKGYE